MAQEENRYTVYRRNSRYFVCDSTFNHLLYKDDIFKTDVKTFGEADNIATQLNWKECTKNQ